MLQLLAATANKHKVMEFKSALADIMDRVSVVTSDTISGFPVLKEDGSSFEENSRMKAVQASAYADMVAFADDSGLEVEALGGAPGIYSSRYAGEGASDADRIAKLLSALKGTENRRAKFVCVISLAHSGDFIASFRGEVSGVIIDAPRGTHGFGYDPVFVPDGYDKTFSELGAEIKDKISHRAKALAKTADFIRNEMAAMGDFEFV